MMLELNCRGHVNLQLRSDSTCGEPVDLTFRDVGGDIAGDPEIDLHLTLIYPALRYAQNCMNR